MPWKWREATSKWLLGSCCDHTEPITLDHERVSCIISKHVAFRHIEAAFLNE